MKIHSSLLELFRAQTQTGGHSYQIQETLGRKANASERVKNYSLRRPAVRYVLTCDFTGQYALVMSRHVTRRKRASGV
jgi:hypothetical protein